MSAHDQPAASRVQAGRCACGAMAAGFCAVREEPVCPACAAVVGGEGG